MKFNVVQGDIAQQESDCIIVNLFEGVTQPAAATGAVDKALGGVIHDLIASGDFTGEAGDTALLYTGGRLPAKRVLVVGLGQQDEFDLNSVRKAGAAAAKRLDGVKGVSNCATIVHGAGFAGIEAAAAAQALVEGMLLAVYKPPQYKRKPDESRLIDCAIVEFNKNKLGAVQDGVDAGRIIGEAVSGARDLSSEPANILYPAEFARRAQDMARRTGLHCTVLGEDEMRELGMNIYLAVSQGSANEAQLIILEHTPPGAEADPPLVLVGKGVTFDTGGISIKPSANMWYMKDDMGGAGAVVSAMEAIARLNLPKRVIGVAGTVENMPDGKAFRPGDILTGITGKTTEIISTDAEGRLILADMLGYVARFEPRAVVDLATLTGAIGVALGPQAAGLFVNDDELKDGLLAAAEASGERLWHMPLYDEYKEAIKSDMAEVKNSGGRGGGVGTSAKYLEHFTEGYPWAHLDIATMTWAKKSPNAYTPTGATGFGVRLLVELVKGY